MVNSNPRYSAAALVARLIRVGGGCVFTAAIVLATMQYQQTHQLVVPVLIVAGGIATAVACFAVSELLSMIRHIAINSFKSSAPELTPMEMESVLANAIRDTTPRPTQDPAAMIADNGARSRKVTCTQCGKKLKIAANSKYKPGDTAKCPNCKERIVV